MSQSILQNGYAILVANTSDLDKQLLGKDQLFQRISEVKKDKEAERDGAISAREMEVSNLSKHIKGLKSSNGSQDDIDRYTSLRDQLVSQIGLIKMQNVNATYDDVRTTHSFFLNRTFKPMVSVAYGYSITGVSPLPLFGSSTSFKIPINGDFIADQAIHLTVSALTATHKDNKVRWFDFIGHRIIREVRLVMDGVVLDRYGSEEMEMYYRFHVNTSLQAGWQRCVGQETPMVGTFLQDPENQSVRERKTIYDGYQTQKNIHDDLDLYIPLLFWYNLDPAFALSNWNISYDKFFIEIDLAEITDCISVIDYANDGGKFMLPRVTTCDLITNHVYTLPEVSELFKHRSQFSIMRVHRRVDRILDKPFDNVNISDIKFAVENLYVRFRPIRNDLDINRAEVWRLNDANEYREIKYPSIVKIGGVTSLAYTPVYYYKSSPIVTTLSLISNGSVIYDAIPGTFYNSYIPLRFGGDKIRTPTETGAYLMTFSIYPGESQPSGYLNFSQSREQYIGYTSNFIDVDNHVSLSVCATCINFLIMSHGSMSIRYST